MDSTSILGSGPLASANAEAVSIDSESSCQRFRLVTSLAEALLIPDLVDLDFNFILGEWSWQLGDVSIDQIKQFVWDSEHLEQVAFFDEILTSCAPVVGVSGQFGCGLLEELCKLALVFHRWRKRAK